MCFLEKHICNRINNVYVMRESKSKVLFEAVCDIDQEVKVLKFKIKRLLADESQFSAELI